MGCLKFLIKVIVVIFAIIGFRAVGGWDFISSKWSEFSPFEKPSQEAMIEKSRDIADFSRIPDEYEITRSANIFGFKAVIAEHDATGQKLAVVNENKTIHLSKKDFKDGSLQKKIDEATKKLSYQYVHVENLKITKTGKMRALEQTVPYAAFEAEVTNLPVKKVKGIISVAETEEGKNKILISANTGNKYSQIIAEQFFKKVYQSNDE